MALIKRVTTTPNLDFVGKRNLFLALSAGLVTLSVVLILTLGLNFGVDFRGGILVEVRTTAVCDISDLRARLSGQGLGEVGHGEAAASGRQHGDLLGAALGLVAPVGFAAPVALGPSHPLRTRPQPARSARPTPRRPRGPGPAARSRSPVPPPAS